MIFLSSTIYNFPSLRLLLLYSWLQISQYFLMEVFVGRVEIEIEIFPQKCSLVVSREASELKVEWDDSIQFPDKHRKQIVDHRFVNIFIIIGFGPYSLQIYCILENENHQESTKSRNFLLFNNSSIAINSECCFWWKTPKTRKIVSVQNWKEKLKSIDVSCHQHLCTVWKINRILRHDIYGITLLFSLH